MYALTHIYAYIYSFIIQYSICIYIYIEYIYENSNMCCPPALHVPARSIYHVGICAVALIARGAPCACFQARIELCGAMEK